MADGLPLNRGDRPVTGKPPGAGDNAVTVPGPRLTDRELINSWVLVSSFGPYVTALRERYSQIPEGADTGIGYVYVDPFCGISLKVECLCIGDDERLGGDASFPLSDHASLRFRYSALRKLDLKHLDGEEVQRFDLPEIPEWTRSYGTPDLTLTRNFRWLDPFRAPGFFDDVMAVLHRKEGNVPELVWVRLSRYIPETDRFVSTMLNEPFRGTGVHKNDVVEVQVVREPGGISLLVIPVRVSPEDRAGAGGSRALQ